MKPQHVALLALCLVSVLLTGCSSEAEEWKKKFMEEADAHKQAVQELTSKLSDLEGKVTQAVTDKTLLQKTINQGETLRGELQMQIGQLKKDADDLAAQLTDWSSQLDDKNAEVNRLKASLATAADDAAAQVAKAKADAQAQIDALTRSKEDLLKTTEDQAKRIEELEAKILQMGQQLKDMFGGFLK
jgi:chromosome segregation ATPase